MPKFPGSRYFEDPQSDLYEILEAADGVKTELSDNYGSQGWVESTTLTVRLTM
ncbi:MAG: hypothetical protein Ct9H300mP14_07890 [Gammaproteobacteria bacterium]|nr:MAG: hypothetical protein Ct9H300mP14_07890 [Gammaproteobacteria bacterium]